MIMIDSNASSNCPICGYDRPHGHEMKGRWIGVDFDETLAYHVHNRTDPYTLGEPIPEMVSRVKDWIAKGFEVRVMTARMFPISTHGGERDLDRMDKLLKAWTLKHIGVALKNTCMKDGFMEVLWDDRAVHVVSELGMPSWAVQCQCATLGPDYCLIHAA